MYDRGVASRRFTEKEAGALLRKAAELQAKGSASEGISLEELRAAASEIGISPQTFAAAVEQMDVPAGPGKVGFWGGPSQFAHEQVIEGTLTEDGWEEILIDLRRTFGEQGTVNVRGTTREWTATGGGTAEVIFSARQVGGSVRFSGSSNLSGLGGVIYIVGTFPLLVLFAVLGKVFSSSVSLGPAVVGALGAAFVTLGFLGLRKLFTGSCAGYQTKWSGFFARSAAKVSAGGVRAELGVGTPVDEDAGRQAIRVG